MAAKRCMNKKQVLLPFSTSSNRMTSIFCIVETVGDDYKGEVGENRGRVPHGESVLGWNNTSYSLVLREERYLCGLEIHCSASCCYIIQYPCLWLELNYLLEYGTPAF